jgi:hypothetical protein
LAAIVIVAAIPIPLVLRRRLRRPVRSLGLHYVLGYAAAGLAIAHSILSISRRQVPPAAEVGLWLGSMAALAVVAQVMTGRGLRDVATAARRRLRTIHLVLMGAVLVLVALHVVLNGPLPR